MKAKAHKAELRRFKAALFNIMSRPTGGRSPSALHNSPRQPTPSPSRSQTSIKKKHKPAPSLPPCRPWAASLSSPGRAASGASPRQSAGLREPGWGCRSWHAQHSSGAASGETAPCPPRRQPRACGTAD